MCPGAKMSKPTNAGALAALKAARQFITNGVELGFIRMPDSDTPDPAHDTLPMIEGAIAELEAKASTQRDSVLLSGTEMVSVPRSDIDLLVSCQQGTYVAPEGESCLATGLKVFQASARLETVLAESDTECAVVPVSMESLQVQIVAAEANNQNFLTDIRDELCGILGTTGPAKLEWLRQVIEKIDKAVESGPPEQAPSEAPSEQAHTYADEPLSRIKAMGALVQDARGINISGDARKVSAFLLCSAAVPELVARIEELEARG